MAEHPPLTLKAIAVDDEPLALTVIEHFCGRVPGLQLLRTFIRPGEALAYLQEWPVDLLFLDIQMPGLSGIEFRKKVSPETLVIFTTAHSSYAVEGFELEAMDYLLKPFTFERFQRAAERALRYTHLSRQAVGEPGHIFLRADYNLHRVNLADIVLVEGLDDYLKIHVAQGKSLVVRMTMKAMQERLPAAEFVRVHKSFIVPLKRIELFRNKVIHIAGREVPLGGTYERAFMEAIGQG